VLLAARPDAADVIEVPAHDRLGLLGVPRADRGQQRGVLLRGVA
jgi:hypothetical protein